MSSLISSRVEIEPHQIAVVRRILQDQNPKYLLADEVGLGKTIEAGWSSASIFWNAT
jgi:ATP-dependent helicase HepA